MSAFDKRLGTSNQALIDLVVDYAIATLEDVSPTLAIAFHPAVDSSIAHRIESQGRSNRLTLGAIKLNDGQTDIVELARASGSSYVTAGEPVLLVMKHSFYGLSRDRSEALIASLPLDRIDAIMLIDQTDSFDAEAGGVRTLVDSGGREYEAECHDFGNLLQAAGFRGGVNVQLPSHCKSLTGVIVALKSKAVDLESVAAHGVSSQVRIAEQNRRAVNAERKEYVATVRAPRRLILEPSSKCNFLCPKCVYPIMKRDTGFIDVERVTDFLNAWIREIGPFENVDLTGSGDVLVNKNFVDVIKAFNQALPNAKITATSNLALLKPETADQLLDAGLRHWQVSFDSADEDEFNKFTGSKRYRTVLANIKMLYSKMQERPTEGNTLAIVAHRPFDEHYESGMAAIRDLLREHSTTISCTPYQSLNGRIEGEAYRASEKHFYDKSVSEVVCTYPWDDLVVVHTGDVRVCCSDMFDSDVTFGNIFRDTPKEILNSAMRAHYKDRLLAGKASELYLCKDCHAPYAPV